MHECYESVVLITVDQGGDDATLIRRLPGEMPLINDAFSFSGVVVVENVQIV